MASTGLGIRVYKQKTLDLVTSPDMIVSWKLTHDARLGSAALPQGQGLCILGAGKVQVLLQGPWSPPS